MTFFYKQREMKTFPFCRKKTHGFGGHMFTPGRSWVWVPTVPSQVYTATRLIANPSAKGLRAPNSFQLLSPLVQGLSRIQTNIHVLKSQAGEREDWHCLCLNYRAASVLPFIQTQNTEMLHDVSLFWSPSLLTKSD